MVDRISLLSRQKILQLSDVLEVSPALRTAYSPEELREINRIANIERTLANSKVQELRNLDGRVDSVAGASVLQLRNVTFLLDKHAAVALKATGEHYSEELRNLPVAPVARPRIMQRGMTATIAKVTKRLNARGLDDWERALLALPPLYEFLLIEGVDDHSVDQSDYEGLADHVLRSVRGNPRRFLLDEIVGRILDAEHIELDVDALRGLVELVSQRGVSLRSGITKPAVLNLIDEGKSLGRLTYYVDRYAARGEIDPDLFTANTRREMARFLLTRGLKIPDDLAFENGLYDEHFLSAFDHSVLVEQGHVDPVDVARTKGGVTEWNFKIRRISEADRPVIRKEAILAAGALYATFVEGEQMHIFDVADALLTEWHTGELDVSDGKTESALNRYEILMRDRPTEEERHMHYRRVFNIGDANLLSGTVINEPFAGLWDNMMREATLLIAKLERYFTEEKFISRSSLYQTIRDLQYNLSEFVTGSTPKKTHEMYSHLEEALDIIGSQEVLNHLGGQRKSIVTAVQRTGKKHFNVTIPAPTLLDIAEQGYDIFAFIADFAPENVEEDKFQAFLDACKSVIRAQASLEPEPELEERASYTDDDDERLNGSVQRRGGRSHHQVTYPVGRGSYDGAAGFDDWES